jgi:UPF0755 protein
MKGRTKVVMGLVVLVLPVVALGVGVRTLIDRMGGPADYAGPGTGSVTVQVKPGDSASTIATTLADADVVASAAAFIDAANADPASRGLQPGYFTLRTQMSAAEALGALLDPASRQQSSVTVPEGLRVDQTVALLAKATGVPRSRFEKVLQQPQGLALPSYANGDPEGFLFPATYQFDPGAGAKQILGAMVQRFRQAAAQVGLTAKAAASGQSPRDVVIIASLIQAEVHAADFGKAARVVLNRLAAGMPLQFDSTVNFALNSNDLTLTQSQLGFDSPYNTYKYAGLTPGPIDAPGEAALTAALAPPAGNWLYFVTVDPATGKTTFTADYQEFLRLKQQFENSLG